MLEKIKKRKYRFEEQIKIYNKYKSKLSTEEKSNIIEDFILAQDFWGYFELITAILYDIASDSNDYVILLEKTNEKVKRDMAQGPFLDMLKKIGENKQSIAISLYKKIDSKSKDDDLKVVSGLILGGYAIKNDSELKKYLKKEIKYPQTNSILKAIMYKYSNKKLNESIYQYINKVNKTKDRKILQELMNFCIVFFNKNKKYFYEEILNLIKQKDKNISYLLFNRLTHQNKLNQKQILEVVEYSKDLDEFVIDKILEVLKKYPWRYKEISELIIYWLNKDLEFKLRHLDWVLEELVKKNKLFIKYFLENYKKIKIKGNNSYISILPHLFKTLSKYHTNYALDQIFKLNLKNYTEKYLFFELNKVIIGNIYNNLDNKSIIIKLNDKLLEIVKKRDYIDFNEDKYKQKRLKKELSKEEFDYLIDFANNLLIQLRNRKEEYNFKKVNKNLKEYSNLYKLGKEVIKNSEDNRKFSPLLWLGENESPGFKDINISDKDSEINRAFKIEFIKNRFWPKAYLLELDKDIRIIEKKSNEKFKDKNTLIKNIKKKLSNETQFWDYFSELIFINKFKENIIKAIEPVPPYRKNKNLDLKIKMFNRDIYFEITRPQMDRKLRLDNGAVALSNKGFSAIDKKYRQLFHKKTLKEIKKGTRKDIFFIVIDRTNSTIDEHQLIDSFSGSLAYTWQIDKETGEVINQYVARKKDSISNKNKNTDIISGVIYFKQELIFKGNTPKIILKGDIIQNPNAKNKLNKEEINKLRKIIFS